MSGSGETAAGLKRIIHKSNFDPSTFVKNLNAKGEHNMEQMISGLETLVEQTSSDMKQTVYKNYSLFIEAAKEVSILEGEMHQMHNLLNEQKRILQNLTDTQLFTEEGTALSQKSGDTGGEVAIRSSTDSREALAYLLEHVEGSAAVAEIPNRRLIFHGGLRELDPETGAERQQVYGFLLNDSLLLSAACSVPGHSGGTAPLRYRLLSTHDLDSISAPQMDTTLPSSTGGWPRSPLYSLVNSDAAFYLKIFPDLRQFEPQSHSKDRWLHAIESAKRRKMAADSCKRDSSVRDSGNPFVMEIVSDILSEPPLLDALDDLDVFLAERKFEDAVKRLESCQQVIRESSVRSPGLLELRARLEQRVKSVTAALVEELSRPANVSLRAGPRASRLAVQQLVRLDKSLQAAELFLAHRAAISIHKMSELRREENQVIFARKLIAAFYRCLVETWREFKEAGLITLSGCKPLLVRWTRDEMARLGNNLLELFPSEEASFTSFCAAMQVARLQAAALQTQETPGADLAFFLHSRLAPDWEAALNAETTALTAAADKRAADEKWSRTSRSNAREMESFLREMELAGVPNLRKYLEQREKGGDTFVCKLRLAGSTLQMAKSVLELADGVAKLYTRELHTAICDAVAGVLRADFNHFQRCLSAQQLMQKRDFILSNLCYILDDVLPIVDHKLSGASSLNVSVHFDSYTAVKKSLCQLRDSARAQVV